MNDHTPRRRIALLISDPAADYSQSVINGVRDQCARYHYDLLVFSTMVKVCHPDKVYLNGELIDTIEEFENNNSYSGVFDIGKLCRCIFDEGIHSGQYAVYTRCSGYELC